MLPTAALLLGGLPNAYMLTIFFSTVEMIKYFSKHCNPEKSLSGSISQEAIKSLQ
jgi:hypothetical protein